MQGLAHRTAWELTYGPIEDPTAHLDHLCRVHPCVRPTHLELVTRAENIRRGDSPPGINSRKTHCDNGHEYTPENTLIDGGYRRCRACRNEWYREKHRRVKAKAIQLNLW